MQDIVVGSTWWTILQLVLPAGLVADREQEKKVKPKKVTYCRSFKYKDKEYYIFEDDTGLLYDFIEEDLHKYLFENEHSAWHTFLFNRPDVQDFIKQLELKIGEYEALKVEATDDNIKDLIDWHISSVYQTIDNLNHV